MAKKKKDAAPKPIETPDYQNEAQKEAAISAAMSSIEKEFGVRVFQLQDQKIEKVQVIPTGVLSLDRAMRVFGFPRGRIIELFGEEGSGKTMLSLLAAGEVQRSGGKVAFIDMECTFDSTFARLLGVDPDKLYYTNPGSAEQALETAERLINTHAFDLIILDSVANMTPQEELDGSMTDKQVGLLARVMSKGLRKLTNAISRTNTCMVFINQLRMKIGVMYGDPRTTTGGKALPFYASMRIEVMMLKGGQIKIGDKIVGHRSHIRVKKNKVGPPFGEGEVSVYYSKGIDVVRDVCTVAKEEGIITGTSWLSYISEKYEDPTGSKEFKTQGFDNFVDGMRSRMDIIQEMRERVIAKIEAETAVFQQNRNDEQEVVPEDASEE